MRASSSNRDGPPKRAVNYGRGATPGLTANSKYMVRRRAVSANDRPRRAAERGGVEPQPRSYLGRRDWQSGAAPRRFTLRISDRGEAITTAVRRA